MALEIEPKLLWNYFAEISKIPRCSGNEKAVGDFIEQEAEKLGLKHIREEIGNVIVYVDATKGFENKPPIILQAHLDMVCEKNRDVKHDFTKDPIKLIKDKDWIHADGTTLGADNGVGVASLLAIMADKELKHGPLELVFTISEETGMDGAYNLNPEHLKGKILINVDSEEDDHIYIGCAGFGGTILKYLLDYEPIMGEAYRISVTGLRGGHSGGDIHLGRANAIKVLSRILWFANQEHDFQLVDFISDSKINAIPREAFATITVTSEEKDKLFEYMNELAAQIKKEYEEREPNFTFKIEKVKEPKQAISGSLIDDILDMLMALPHGVVSMSHELPDLVETSNNLAYVKIENDQLVIGTSTRSSIASALKASKATIMAIADLAGAIYETTQDSPAWTPNFKSELVNKAKKIYKDLFNEEPKVKAIHAGLETAIFYEKIPGIDMISIGPTIEHPHSPEERVSISSVQKFWKFLLNLLELL